jgi:hypothetical protein
MESSEFSELFLFSFPLKPFGSLHISSTALFTFLFEVLYPEKPFFLKNRTNGFAS